MDLVKSSSVHAGVFPPDFHPINPINGKIWSPVKIRQHLCHLIFASQILSPTASRHKKKLNFFTVITENGSHDDKSSIPRQKRKLFSTV